MTHVEETPQTIVCIVSVSVIFLTMCILSIRKLRQKLQTSLIKRIITLYFSCQFLGFYLFPYRSFPALFLNPTSEHYTFVCVVFRSISTVFCFSLASLIIIYVYLLQLVLCTKISYQLVQVMIPVSCVVYSILTFFVFNLNSFLHADLSTLASSCIEETVISLPYISSIVLYAIQLKTHRTFNQNLYYDYINTQMYDIEQISNKKGITGFLIARLIPIITQWIWNVIWLYFFEDETLVSSWIATVITIFNAVFNAAPFLML